MADNVGNQWNQGQGANGNVTAIMSPREAYIVLQQMDDKTRKNIANQLKNFGFKVPTSGKIDYNFVNSYIAANAQAQGWAGVSGQKFNAAFFQDYLANPPSKTGSGGGPSTTSYTAVSDPTTAKKLIDQVFSDLIGRTASKAEVAKYTKMLQAQQKKNPTRVTSGDGYQSQTGGLNEQQYLIDELAGTDDAKRKRALDAYSMLNDFLGGGA